MTYSQFEALFNYAQKRSDERLKINAAMHGIDLKKAYQKHVEETKNKELVFKDPSEYEQMTKEEREALTQQMMRHHTGVFQKAQGIKI